MWEEIRNFGDIFLIARRSGGNLGKILGNLAEVLGEKIRVTGEIQVAIAGKKTGTAGDEYGSGSDDPLYAGDFQRISGCLIS